MHHLDVADVALLYLVGVVESEVWPGTVECEVWPGTVEWGCILVVDISTDTHAGKIHTISVSTCQ